LLVVISPYMAVQKPYNTASTFSILAQNMYRSERSNHWNSQLFAEISPLKLGSNYLHLLTRFWNSAL